MLEMCPAYTDKRLDDDAFLASLSLAPGKRRHRVLMCRGAVLLKHKKTVSGQPAHVGQWPLSKKVVATVCPLHFDTKSEKCVR